MRLKACIPMALMLLALCSCSTPKNITYFQYGNESNTIGVATPKEITVKNGDKISIVVNSQDPTLSAMFNLPIMSYRAGDNTGGNGGSQQLSCYTVDKEGNIDFPVLGKVNVLNYNRETIADTIKKRLISEELVKDAVVTVEFANLYVSVLGEVNHPGRFDIKHDVVTLLDAIGMAGDLTIFGEREHVVVWRQEGDSVTSYTVNLTSSKDIYTSPAFYLQQKDVVYVEPNDVRKRQSTVNGNTVRSASFWMSLVSMLTSTGVLITNFIR